MHAYSRNCEFCSFLLDQALLHYVHVLTARQEVDEFPGNDYMDLLQYPVVDSLIGLEGFDNEDLGTSNIFGQSILYNMSNVHDG